jgi:Domain of unknown function (DUF4062)
MSGYLPSVFVSSTFYDLRQIRKDLADFVQDALGYRFLISEHPSFPIDPDANTVENCRRIVEQEADILVLLIGGRYGSLVLNTDKSVTNLEYLTARAKRIPVFAFVIRDVLALLPTWEKNPGADFTASVDSPRVFEFIKQVRSTDSVWTFPFDSAQDVISALRTQLAYIMRRGLHAAVSMAKVEPELLGLKGTAFRIALERPDGWEGRLFAQIVVDEVAAAADLRGQHLARISVGRGEIVAESETSTWVSAATAEGSRMVADFERVIKKLVNDAFSSGATQTIAFGARQVGFMYRETLAWAACLRRAHVDPDWRPVVFETSCMLDDVLQEMESFGPRLLSEIERALAPGTPKKLTVPFTFHVDAAKVNEEIEKLKSKRGLT